MLKPERTSYTALDFHTFRELNLLELTPKFQRRSVWSTAARSYFIDTLLRGMPVPPIYIRTRQSDDKKTSLRQVVDGQQRMATVLSFMDDEFALSRSLGLPYAGSKFSQLQEQERNAIRNYSFICENLLGVSDEEVLDVFARLNTYGVRLNSQELRNGKYFGQFKQCAYRLAHEHLEFWRTHRIFTERAIARMTEVELTSELLIAELDGMQDKKKSIDRFYAEYDEQFPARKQVSSRLRRVIDIIEDSAGSDLKSTKFKSPALFYTLFAAVYHRRYGLPKVKIHTPKKALSEDERARLASAVRKLSDILDTGKEHGVVAQKYQSFVVASARQTDNIGPRKTRFDLLYKEAFT